MEAASQPGTDGNLTDYRYLSRGQNTKVAEQNKTKRGPAQQKDSQTKMHTSGWALSKAQLCFLAHAVLQGLYFSLC
jgi:hypothetical protein